MHETEKLDSLAIDFAFSRILEEALTPQPRAELSSWSKDFEMTSHGWMNKLWEVLTNLRRVV
jgi:hypothetical protein